MKTSTKIYGLQIFNDFFFDKKTEFHTITFTSYATRSDFFECFSGPKLIAYELTETKLFDPCERIRTGCG